MSDLDKPFAAWMLTIEIREKGGLFFATSKQEPKLFASARSRPALDEAVKHAVSAIYAGIHHRKVGEIVRRESDSDRASYWVVSDAPMAAQHC